MRKYLFIVVTAGLAMLPMYGGPAATSAIAKSLPHIRVNHSLPTSGQLGEPNVSAHPALHKSAHAASGLAPSTTSGGCSDTSATNVRVNQDCTQPSEIDAGLQGRGQAQNETAVAVNPTNSDNVIASQNDYRRGDGNCGADWSLDGGQTWGSQTLPMAFTTPGFTNPRHYWDAGGDTSVAFDSTGEAYEMCQVFNRGGTSDTDSNASAFLLFRSADGGASWSFDGDPVVQSDGTGNDGIGLLDKEYMTIDNNPNSPHPDRIYVTWTQFSANFTSAPIMESHSDDHGVTWSNPVNTIPNLYPALCPINFSGSPTGTCDQNQFSDPFVAPNGDLYVTFDNYNNCAGAFGPPCKGGASDNHNQILVVKSIDGGDSFQAPVRIANFWDLPDCFTYTGQDEFRACVPDTNGDGHSVFRAANYPSGVAVNNSTIVVDFGSYLNHHSNPGRLGNCSPAGFSSTTGLNKYNGVGTVNGCNNDIVRATSTDGGGTWDTQAEHPGEYSAVNNESANGPLADQFFQWAALNPQNVGGAPVKGGPVADAYYDRKYGTDQADGSMDITLEDFGAHVRMTDASFPSPADFPDSDGFSLFMGDYNGLAISSDHTAHPVWTDNRNPDPIWSTSGDARTITFSGNDEDIYTRAFQPVG